MPRALERNKPGFTPHLHHGELVWLISERQITALLLQLDFRHLVQAGTRVYNRGSVCAACRPFQGHNEGTMLFIPGSSWTQPGKYLAHILLNPHNPVDQILLSYLFTHRKQAQDDLVPHRGQTVWKVRCCERVPIQVGGSP